MKKLLGIVVLGLLWCNISFASCGLSKPLDYKAHWSGDSAWRLEFYNHNSKTVTVKKINYYKANSELYRSYDVNIKVIAKSDATYVHRTNMNYSLVKSWSVNCVETYKSSSNVDYSKYTKKKKESWFKWWYLLAIPLLGVIVQAFEDNEKNKKTKETVKKNKPKEEPKVENSGPQMTGTAFFIDKKGHLITNFHVVANSSNRLKVIYEGEEVKAKIIAKDETLDLALLKVSIKNESYIEVSDKVLKKMQSIVAAGYPALHLSDDLKLTSGIISSLKGIGNNSALIQIDAALNPGNSGGPIIDKDKGHLAAVAVARMEGSHYQSINYGIKASRVKEFIESNSVTLPLEIPKTKKIKRKDISEVLESSTVLIYH